MILKTLTEKEFLKDIGKHEMSIMRDEKLLRHIRFKQPNTSNMCFEIVTWPEYLCYTGDMGTFVFSRLPDMFDFFRADKDKQASAEKRGQTLYVNHDYWADKLKAVDCYDGVKKYSSEKFKEHVRQRLKERMASKALCKAVKEDVLSCADDGEQAARRATNDFKFENNYIFSDFWECDCTEYTYRYLWCCFALAWGIGQYDKTTLSPLIVAE